MLSRRPPLPWQVRVGDPQAASVALSDAVRPDAARPDAALPDADACCDAPPPFPGHSPCPRAAAARARHHTAMPCLYRVLYVSRVYGLGACAEPRGT